MKLLKRSHFFWRSKLPHQHSQRRLIECKVEQNNSYVPPIIPSLQGYSLGTAQYKEQSQTSFRIQWCQICSVSILIHLKDIGCETMFPQNGDSYLNHFSSTVKISSYYTQGQGASHKTYYECTSGVLLNDGKHILSCFHDNSDYQDGTRPKNSGPGKRYLTESMTENMTESDKNQLLKRNYSFVSVYGASEVAYDLEPVCYDPDSDLTLFKIVDCDAFKRFTSPVGHPIAGMNIGIMRDDLSKYDAIHMIGGCYDLKNQKLQTSLGHYASMEDNAQIFGDWKKHEVQCFGFSLDGAIKAHAALSNENKKYSLKNKLESDFDNKIGSMQLGNDCGFENGIFLKSPISCAHSSSGGGVSVSDNEIVAICSGWNGNSLCGVISKSKTMMKALQDRDIV